MEELSHHEIVDRWPHLAQVVDQWGEQIGLDPELHVRYRVDDSAQAIIPTLDEPGIAFLTAGVCTIKRTWPSRDTLTVGVTWQHAGLELRTQLMVKVPKDGSRSAAEVEISAVELVALQAAMMKGKAIALLPIPLSAAPARKSTVRRATTAPVQKPTTKRPATRGAAALPTLAGTVSDVLDTLSMLQHLGKSGKVVLTSEDASLSELELWLVRGDIARAAAGGGLRDLQALDLLLTSTYAAFHFHAGEVTDRTITVPTASILLDIARRRDELAAAAAKRKSSRSQRSNPRRPSIISGITDNSRSRPRPFQRDLDRLCTELKLYPSAHNAPVGMKLNHIRSINQRRELIVKTVMENAGADGFALDGRMTQRKVAAALRAIRAQAGPFTGNPWDDKAVISFLVKHLAVAA